MAGQGLCLLSLDGGGVRGLSSLYILKLLMEQIDPVSPPKPCNFFQMIGGTSTGGLMAIMLGRLRMSVDDCIKVYAAMSENIFTKQKHRVNIKGNVQARFDTAALESAVKKSIRDAGLTEDDLLYNYDPTQCKVFVSAMTGELSSNMQFTSYISRSGNSDLLQHTKIWEAARATSAASSFFDPISIGPNRETFVDGAVGENNPIRVLWDEAKYVWQGGRLEDRIKCIVSIGTGVPSMEAFGTKFWEIAQTLQRIATETEKTASNFHRDHMDLSRAYQYYRFNVSQGLQKVGLEDAKQRGVIAAATREYIRSPTMEETLSRFKTIVNENETANPSIPSASPAAQFPPPAVPATQSPARSFAFHNLDSNSTYVNRAAKSDWRKLTEKSLSVYERIYEACKSLNGTVTLSSFRAQIPAGELRDTLVPTFWSLLANTNTNPPLSRNLTLALTYMLHMRSITGWEPSTISPRRRKILESYGNWVDCACERCGRKWNFANDTGFQRNLNEKRKCAADEYLRALPGLQFMYKRGGQFYRDNQLLWLHKK